MVAAVVGGLLLFGIVGGVLAFGRYLDNCRMPDGVQEEVAFTVPKGATGSEVIDALAANQIVECPMVARWDLKKRGEASSIQAGNYTLLTNSDLDSVLEVFAGGQKISTVSVTIPEGWTAEQMIPELSKRLSVPPAELRTEIDRGRSLPYLPAGKPLEGFLFPKTYEFKKTGLTPGGVVDAMVAQFSREAKKLDWSNAKRLGVTPYEVVIIASMIEREAQVASERPKVAAVIYNRLDMKEPLGIDATLVYVDPNPADGITQSDLEIDSPYNTRLHLGLPPTPIANPGLASLRAALEPARTDDWLYVLCGDDGHHVFTDSYQEFLSEKSRCLG